MTFRAVVLICFAAHVVVDCQPDPKAAWLEFKKKFDKTFNNGDDEQAHFAAFQSNLALLDALRQDDPSATYSHLTPFADVTREDFRSTHLGFDASLNDPSDAPADPPHNETVPAAFDWRTKGAVNPVKNQKQCGSCWSFATVANIEGVNFVTNQKLVSLSEQELVDCDKMDNGCGGGLPSNAYKDMIKTNLGLEPESAYPYQAKNGQCHAQKSLEQVFIQGWKAISTDETQIAAALIQYGPLAIGINANPMQLYFGGVANPSNCNPQQLDHGVAIVAFGVDGSKNYWTIRNSWGAGWGEQGYYRIIRGIGKCGLNTMVTTATMGSGVITV